MEGLETRVLLAAHTWTGAGGDSNWSDAANWTDGAPAAAESNVTLDFPGGVSNTSATNDITGLTIQSITVEGSYFFYGADFSLSGSISTSLAGGGGIYNNITLTSDATLNLGGQLNIVGTISGPHNLLQNGGTVYLSGNNTYSGTTTIASGLLYLGSNTGSGAGSVVVDSGGAIMLDLGLNCAEPLTLSGSGGTNGMAAAALFPREATTSSFTTTATWSGPITLSGNASVAGRPASDGGLYGVQSTLDITGNIGGSGDLTVTNGGVTLAGVNNFSGNTIINAGELTLQSAGIAVPANLVVNGGSIESVTSGQLAPTSSVMLGRGTTLTLDTGDTEAINSLTGNGTVNGGGNLIDQTSGTDLFLGNLNSSVSFTLNGNGELFLDGSGADSTTTGQIMLARGSLIVNANMPNATLIQAGGELGGGGTVAGFISNGGNMELGPFNPGTLTVTGPVNLLAASTFDWIAADSTDTTGIATTGPVTIAGSFAIANLGYTPAAGTVFDVVHNTSLSPVSGTFSGMPEGQIITYQNGNWQLSYVGGDGNDVTLTYLGLPTIIAASTEGSPAVLGQAVLQATVFSVIGGQPIPTGNVTFKDGSTVLGTASLDNTGTATFDAASLPVGNYTLTAYYDGDHTFETSGPSSGISQSVTQATSTLGLNVSSNTVAAGAQVRLTASVNTGGIAVVPTGTVTFYSNGTAIGSASLDGSGDAVLNTTSLEAGDDVITASYGGDADYAASTSLSPATVTVIPALSFSDATISKSATGATVSFTVSLNSPSSLPVTVNYTTQDGTAMAGRDYASASGTVTFAPGQTSQSIAVDTLGDATWQPDRSFSVLYSSASNASVSTITANATIQSTDGMPAAGLIADELDPTQTDLVVYATAGNNVIQVKPTRIAGQVEVMINGKAVATDSGIDRVIIYGGSGNNTLTVNPRVASGVIFFGATGRHTVATAGGGNDILIGGNGPNTLTGGGGMNLLIGGAGKATLTGGMAGNVLVGGATSYDAGKLSDIFNLETLLSTWTDGAPYVSRAAALASANAPSFAVLDSSTMALNAADHLSGKKTRDLLFAAPVTKAAHAAR